MLCSSSRYLKSYCKDVVDGAVQKLCFGPSLPGQYLEVSEQGESLELDSLVRLKSKHSCHLLWFTATSATCTLLSFLNRTMSRKLACYALWGLLELHYQEVSQLYSAAKCKAEAVSPLFVTTSFEMRAILLTLLQY